MLVHYLKGGYMLYKKLSDYAKNGIYPFHMPGHKRNLNDDILPYSIDITEINDFDNLHNAEGCIKKIAEKAEKLYSVNSAFLLVNGATGGILSAIRAMTNYGDKIAIARNCHKSVYNAVEVCGLDVEYILPDTDEAFGIFSSVKPEQIKNLLENNSDIKLVVITSPTYEGIVSDISAIAEICHKHNAKLFVDEAHGAHFPFGDNFPKEAISCGADAVVVSIHKTLPSFTQTALLLTNDKILSEKFAENLSIFESSSPSYVLMASIEKCLEYVENNKIKFELYSKWLRDFYSMCFNLDKLVVLNSANDKYEHNFFDYDIGKIIISTVNTDISGTELAQILREKYKLETEMAYSNYVIAMTSVCDNPVAYHRLLSALIEIDKRLTFSQKSYFENYAITLPEKIFCSSKRYLYEKTEVKLEEAEGHISMEYVWAYPPGIPIISVGERISKNEILLIKNLRIKGVDVYSTYKSAPDKIYVVK